MLILSIVGLFCSPIISHSITAANSFVLHSIIGSLRSPVLLFYILLLARFARQFYCFTFYYWLASLANSIVLHSIIGSLRSPILLFYILLLARFARQFYCYVRILYRFVFNFYFFLYTSVRNIYVYFCP
jgi:hypothetical protein